MFHIHQQCDFAQQRLQLPNIQFCPLQTLHLSSLFTLLCPHLQVFQALLEFCRLFRNIGRHQHTPRLSSLLFPVQTNFHLLQFVRCLVEFVHRSTSKSFFEYPTLSPQTKKILKMKNTTHHLFAISNTPDMSPSSTSDKVPDDVWICCECEGSNLIALAEEKCPVCKHSKCKSCTGPGQAYPGSTTRSAAQYQLDYQDEDLCPALPGPASTILTSFYAMDFDASSYGCDGPDRLVESIFPSYFIDPKDIFMCPGAGAPASGAWTCTNCGAGNGDATPDWCPACGASR